MARVPELVRVVGVDRGAAEEHPGSPSVDGPGRKADEIRPDPGQRADARRRGELERVAPAAAVDDALDQEGAGNQLQEVVAGAKDNRIAAAADDRAAVDDRVARAGGAERDPDIAGDRAVIDHPPRAAVDADRGVRAAANGNDPGRAVGDAPARAQLYAGAVGPGDRAEIDVPAPPEIPMPSLPLITPLLVMEPPPIRWMPFEAPKIVPVLVILAPPSVRIPQLVAVIVPLLVIPATPERISTPLPSETIAPELETLPEPR